MPKFLAHLGMRGPQGLDEHLLGVASATSQAAEKLGLPLAGELIGLLHDLGKASCTFQDYLRSFEPELGLTPRHDLRGKIDHATAGAQCLVRILNAQPAQKGLRAMVAHLLALCIVSHHGGLIDCVKPDGRQGLDDRLGWAEHQTHADEAWSQVSPAVRVRAEELLQDPALLTQCNRKLSQLIHGKQIFGDRDVQLGLFTRMLFSCLIDADRTNTADHENYQSGRHRQRGEYVAWETLLARLEGGMASLSLDGAVNAMRRQISEQCFASASRSPGMYTLTVPTGGGKTLAALRFALEHARLYKMDRIIFVSPYISIVDQNAAVARHYLEPEGTPYASVVLEHHSDLAREREVEPDVDSWRRRVLAENWDAPVVFTTMVQVLEALFGAGTQAVRRLHALGRAVLVFDEVQTLPISMVHLFNNSINLLTAQCGSTVLLCTATQPLLHSVCETRGAAALSASPELIRDVGELFHQLRRYTVADNTGEPGGWTRERTAALVCEEAVAYGGCLLIVNTKRDALAIFELCRAFFSVDGVPVKAKIFHLSTGMCPIHRGRVLEELKLCLKNRESEVRVVCVSTQLIEAGVDIDFPCVVRDLAGLDSIAQAAGRCNRNGVRPQLGRVHIIELPESSEKLIDIRKGRGVAREQLGAWRREHPGEPFPLDRPEQMALYYKAAFFRRKDEMTFPIKAGAAKELHRDSNLLEMLGSNGMAKAEALRVGHPSGRGYLLQSFRTANECFELIQPTQGIVVPYRERGQEIVNILNSTQDFAVEWQVQRQAQPYTVSVYEWQFRKLLADGAIYPVENGTGVYCLRPEFYDENYGLRMEAGLMEAQFG